MILFFPVFAAVLGTVATGIGMLGKHQEARAQNQAAQQAADFNVETMQQDARNAQAQNDEEARRADIDNRKAYGEQLAAFGASGASIRGSALDVLAESARTQQQDLQTIRRGGQLQQQSYARGIAGERRSAQAADSSYRKSKLRILAEGASDLAVNLQRFR